MQAAAAAAASGSHQQRSAYHPPDLLGGRFHSVVTAAGPTAIGRDNQTPTEHS